MRVAVIAILVAGIAASISGSASSGCCPGPGGSDYAPAWSPTGALIAFVRHGQIDIGTYVVRPDGTDLKRVSGWTTFSWSPDGDRLVAGGLNLDVVDTDGRVLRRLGAGAYPSWSPDGRLIAFWSRRGISVVSPDGGTARLVARARSSNRPVVGANRISWSPDSQHLVYTSSRRIRKRWDDQLHVVSVDGTAHRVLASSRTVVNLSSSRGYDASPAWSPDGRTIAFASFRPGGAGIYIVPRTGGPARRISDFPEAHHPAWSPDGTRLVFSGRGDCLRNGVVGIPASGGAPDLITNDCYIVGSDGNDSITGTRGRDIVLGRGGDDTISLDTGDDVGYGDEGDDVLLGDRMNDVLFGGPGHDTLSGGRGNDRLWSAEGEADDLDCGDQVDWVVADRLDRISRDCERVRIVPTG